VGPYDLAGRRSRLTWGDGFYVTYDSDTAGNMTAIRENGAASGIGVLATFAYDDLGRRTSLTRGNGTVTSYAYEPVSRLGSLAHDFAGTTHDLTLGFTYNPASQIATNSRSNDLFAKGGHANIARAETVNGLNQLTAQGATGLTYDGRGNVSTIGAASYGYTSENRLASAPGGYVMTYDPLGRYHWIATGAQTWMQYDGGHHRGAHQWRCGAPLCSWPGHRRAAGVVRRQQHDGSPLVACRRTREHHRGKQCERCGDQRQQL
jgi:YD repeat-containing protein